MSYLFDRTYKILHLKEHIGEYRIHYEGTVYTTLRRLEESLVDPNTHFFDIFDDAVVRQIGNVDILLLRKILKLV